MVSCALRQAVPLRAEPAGRRSAGHCGRDAASRPRFRSGNEAAQGRSKVLEVCQIACLQLGRSTFSQDTAWLREVVSRLKSTVSPRSTLIFVSRKALMVSQTTCHPCHSVRDLGSSRIRKLNLISAQRRPPGSRTRATTNPAHLSQLDGLLSLTPKLEGTSIEEISVLSCGASRGRCLTLGSVSE